MMIVPDKAPGNLRIDVTMMIVLMRKSTTEKTKAKKRNSYA